MLTNRRRERNVDSVVTSELNQERDRLVARYREVVESNEAEIRRLTREHRRRVRELRAAVEDAKKGIRGLKPPQPRVSRVQQFRELFSDGRSRRIADVIEATGSERMSVTVALSRAVREGALVKEAPGVYRRATEDR